MSEFESSESDNRAFYCPITCNVMVDPVVDPDGNSYERAAIEEWLGRTGMSPITRNAMTVADLIVNRALKDAIDRERASLPATGVDMTPLDVSVLWPRLIFHVNAIGAPGNGFHSACTFLH